MFTDERIFFVCGYNQSFCEKQHHIKLSRQPSILFKQNVLRGSPLPIQQPREEIGRAIASAAIVWNLTPIWPLTTALVTLHLVSTRNKAVNRSASMLRRHHPHWLLGRPGPELRLHPITLRGYHPQHCGRPFLRSYWPAPWDWSGELQPQVFIEMQLPVRCRQSRNWTGTRLKLSAYNLAQELSCKGLPEV